MKIDGKYGSAIVYTDDIEQEAISQIINLLNQPMSDGAHVRIMPDVHAGSGCVIGFTARLTDKVVPSIVGVDIGCFSGDTKVTLVDNRELSFEELVEEHRNGKENYCYSIDNNSNVVVGKIENPHQTKISETIYKIELDNGEIIKCTPEHIFFTREHKELAARDLSVGDSLMPLYLDIAENIKFEEKSYQNKKNKLEEYKVVYNPNTQKYDYVHFLSDDYNMIFELDFKENGAIRHHKDFNKLNNNPSNIKRVEWKEHWEIHQEAVRENNKNGITGFSIAHKRNKEFFSKMSSENMKKLHQDPEFCKRRDLRASKHIKEYLTSDKAKEENKTAGQRGKKYLLKLNQPYKCDKCGKVCGNKGAYSGHIKVCKNHKIISIIIENIQIPVYDLQVSGYNNYALASGVFVHNCGMTAWQLGKRSDVGESFDKLDKAIRTYIPSGKDVRKEFDSDLVETLWNTLDIKDMSYVDFLSKIKEICKKSKQDEGRVLASIGSLGGGNHFIEIDKDDNDELWLIIHSGSRNFGLKVATFHQEIAEESLFSMTKEEFDSKVEMIKKIKKGKGIEVAIAALRKEASKKGKATGLEYLEGEDAKAYYHDMRVAQIYAQLSRRVMGWQILTHNYKMKYFLPIESVHNYINFKDNILRKGSISAHLGEKVIIPLNMADGIIYGVGKGNEEWNYSAPHGAGRKMSRSKAKATIRLEDFQFKMKESGVWSSCVGKDTIDEAPQAYKNADKIIDSLSDTVDIKCRMFPVYNFKSVE